MKKHILAVLLLALASTLPAFSQQRWERTYGGSNSDGGYSVQQTSDGGYIVTGYTGSFGNGEQVYLIKTNTSGDSLWTKTNGGTGDDDGWSVQQTTDGGYIVAGIYDNWGFNPQVYVIKTDASGDTLWTRAYGVTRNDLGYSIQQTTDGGYIVAGSYDAFGNNHQVYLIKTNASGDTLWTRTYGGVGRDEGHSVQQTSDGGYIVAGTTTSFGNMYQVYLIKTNAQGDTLWTRTYGDTSTDWGYSVQQATDGGYIVAGVYDYFGTDPQVYLIKTNALGDTIWTKTYGGASSDYGESVQQTQDGGYIIAGWSDSFGNSDQVYLIKTNAFGDTLWTRTYGGSGIDQGFSVRQTSDGGYIVTGRTYSFGNSGQVYLIKTDANGSSGVEEVRNAEFGMRNVELRITPNPFTSFATLPGHEAEWFSLYDVSGRKVGSFKGDRVGEGLVPGVYFLRPESGAAKPLRIVKVR